MFYKIPRSLTTASFSTDYLFLSLNQPLGVSLQDPRSHREVLYKTHQEVFYKLPSTARCQTKYHRKLFYKIDVINRHWVVFYKTKHPFTLGGALNQKSTLSAKLSDFLCVWPWIQLTMKNSICRLLKTVECILIWMLGNYKHMIVRLNHNQGDHTHIFKMTKTFYQKVSFYPISICPKLLSMLLN